VSSLSSSASLSQTYHELTLVHVYCGSTNVRSKDEGDESFHINRQNPITSLCELS